MTATLAPAQVRSGALPGERKPGEALERVDEMIHWIEGQSMPRGGWHSEPRFGLNRGLRFDWWLKRYVPDADVSTTALVGVTLLRTRDRLGRTPYNEALADAVEYVAAAVDASPGSALDLDAHHTPISARVGSYIDTALALLLLAEATEPRTSTNGGPMGPRIEKLIKKFELNQKPQGYWGDGAYNSPLLGHALAVWALEAASRKGHKVDPGVLALAGRWALSKEAQRADAAAAGKWQTKGRGLVPEWLERIGADDEDPINHGMYTAVARLSVLAQADRSNRQMEARLLLAFRSADGPARRAEAARALKAIRTTRATLGAAQQTIAESLTPERGAAPLTFAAEDFVACLLIADSLPPATAGRWFPATVKTLMRWQDMDSGLKTDIHTLCRVEPPGLCECEKYVQAQMTSAKRGLGAMREEAVRGVEGKAREPAIERQFCPDHKSFCSRDRVFCTAAAVAAILADTPYKAAILPERAPPSAQRR
ncbi:MAG: hypothetical protein AVDCRST_MAG64-1264 [uncultured Phycisphaerae bacterium]|uniref:Squalene cyclase C-terminal domain-containing protein n=1 Tax=uncultured Phycisphaerae bacterium TaxID=904963 RepID=A0A6J4NNA0_9BACT|nr:MAG: hypothetical protein AVDCRST_MAG64-1264 [uncultured Phycisphaerae bacterium]